jgi:hypothetical protein
MIICHFKIAKVYFHFLLLLLLFFKPTIVPSGCGLIQMSQYPHQDVNIFAIFATYPYVMPL